MSPVHDATPPAPFEPERGSFRDRGNRVYYMDGRVVRGLDAAALEDWRALSEEAFFRRMMTAGAVVDTKLLPESDPASIALSGQGWAGVLEHSRVPFVSYPYEWTFGMLKDAALLHLDLLIRSLEHGWVLKDASAYNVQFLGAKPVFIDVTSFERYEEGDPWIAYRQFCMMFLIPLLVKAHRDIDFAGFLRSDLEGIDPTRAVKLFPGLRVFERGVFAHVYLHAKSLEYFGRRERSGAAIDARKLKHRKEMVLALVEGMRRTVSKLRSKGAGTIWGDYENNHSYDEASYVAKKDFVLRHVSKRRRSLVWDMGCNTGTFSAICSPHSDHVVAMDGDSLAVERLYGRQKEAEGGNILPLVMNLANLSPNQGWRGRERKAPEERGKPDFVLCLALIHHLVIAANIPMSEVLEWIRSLGATTVLEFVGPEDEMTRRLLRNKADQYGDYTRERFEEIAGRLFEIVDMEPLRDGKRAVYCLEPR